MDGSSIASALKEVVSNIYVILRNISAIILLSLLIYTGIRILLTSASPYQQAKWKQALIDWGKALCLLMLMHFLMIGIFYISDLIVASLKGTIQGDLTMVQMIRNAYSNNSIWDDSEAIITTIMYVYITYLTVVFAIAYFKRLMWIVILIVISPIVAITKALGQQQGKIFDRWLKEYVYTVLLQPFHMLIFFILVCVPLGMLGNDVTSTSFWNKFSFTTPDYGVYIYTLIAISLIRPAEKFLYNLFGFSNSSVAQQGTSESGVKTMKAVEKTVKETVKLVASVAGAVATGRSYCSSIISTEQQDQREHGATGSSGPLGPAGSNGPLGPSGLLGEEEPTLDGQESENDDMKLLHDSGDLLIDNGLMDDDMMDKYVNREDALLQNKSGDKQVAEIDDDISLLHNSGDLLIDNGLMNDDMMDRYVDRENALLQKKSETEQTSENEDGKLDQAVDRFGQAVDKFDGNMSELNISDSEIDIEDKKPKNMLMDRLQNSGVVNYLKSPEGQERLNEIKGSANELRDTMYLGGEAPGEWKSGYDNRNRKIESEKRAKLDAFVNNENNINYMKQEHGLNEKEARARLEEGAPFVNRGIANVEVVDKMISAGKSEASTGNAAESVAKVENVVNDQSRIQSVAQIIAAKTGESSRSPRVQQEAKATMQQARPYVEAGQKDPEVLHRLVQLENGLKNSKAAKSTRTPEKVVKMDNIINKAMKDGLKQIKITDAQSSAGIKKIEGVMNKELKQRLEITDGKTKDTQTRKTKKND